MVKHIRINPDFLLLENTFSRTIHFHGSIVVEGFFTLAFLKIRQKMNDLLQNTCFSIHHQQCKLPSAHSCWNDLKNMAFQVLNGIGGFHLHILVFPFVYQFNSRIVALVYSSFHQMTSSGEFQHHFKICLLLFLYEKECSFYTNLFCCTEMR